MFSSLEDQYMIDLDILWLQCKCDQLKAQLDEATDLEYELLSKQLYNFKERLKCQLKQP